MSTHPVNGGFPWFQQGAFQIDPKATPEEIKRKREALNRTKYGSARYIGQGLGHLAEGIFAGIAEGKLSEAERTGRESAAELFDSLVRGGEAPVPSSTSGPMTVLGIPEAPTEAESVAADTMAALGKAPSRDAVSAYIAQAAEARGIDPSVAVAVAASEGLNADPAEAWQSNFVKDGARERSYGPFQLFIDGGLGNEFMDQTGLDPRDPSTWQSQVDFALDHASKNGWGAWYGARNTGIGNMDGIPGGAPPTVVPAAPSAPTGSAQPAGLSALYSALSNPWLDDTQRAVISQMIAQRQQASDPLRALQIQKAQAEIDAMRNPAPADRRIVKGADGFQYFADTGERVLPGVEAPSAKPTDDMREYGMAVAQGYEGKLEDWLIDQRRAGATSITNNMGEALSPGQRKIDEKFADQWFDWTTGGGADSAKQIAQLQSVFDDLAAGKPLTGPQFGLQPDVWQSWANPEALDAREKVEEVVQRNLRLILGAQFTQAEGERLIARAYNQKLRPEQNAVRLQSLIAQMTAAAQAKQAMVDYFGAEGTLSGFKASEFIPTIDDFNVIFDQLDRRQGVADEGGGATDGVPADLWEHLTPEERALFE